MSRLLIAYAASATFFLAVDLLWLGVLMTATYQAELGPLLLERPRLLPAALFYAAFSVGIVVFAVLPALQAASWRRAALLGALFGLLAYAAYDLTNLATLRGWSLRISLIDMAWGALLTGASAAVGYGAARVLAPRRPLATETTEGTAHGRSARRLG